MRNALVFGWLSLAVLTATAGSTTNNHRSAGSYQTDGGQQDHFD